MNKNIRGIQVSRKSVFVNIGLEVDNTGELFILQVYFIKSPLNWGITIGFPDGGSTTLLLPNDAELYEDYPFECMGSKLIFTMMIILMFMRFIFISNFSEG